MFLSEFEKKHGNLRVGQQLGGPQCLSMAASSFTELFLVFFLLLFLSVFIFFASRVVFPTRPPRGSPLCLNRPPSAPKSKKMSQMKKKDSATTFSLNIHNYLSVEANKEKWTKNRLPISECNEENSDQKSQEKCVYGQPKNETRRNKEKRTRFLRLRNEDAQWRPTRWN